MTNFTPEDAKFLQAICGQGNGYLSISYTMDSHLKSLRTDFIEASDIAAETTGAVHDRNTLMRSLTISAKGVKGADVVIV